MKKMYRTFIVIGFFSWSSDCVAQYHVVAHRKISGNEVAVTKAGTYARPGTTYVLANNITSPVSTIFLGKDVTLDLNGYTIKYADTSYAHVGNSGFEEGLKGWDISKAPGAKLENTADVHVFLGKKLLSLKAGDEIVSPYVNLLLADRSYFAICGVTGFDYKDMDGDLRNQMRVSVYVEDGKGNNVKCVTDYSDTTLVSCPVENRAPRLGGGFVYAHLNHLPAGKYRVRVKAETDCLVDEIDIRPAMDVGIGIIEQTNPKAHYDHMFKESYPPPIPSFFDYTADVHTGQPISSIPQVTGEGSIIIRNGVIENGSAGILNWGIQSTAKQVKIILENVKIKTTGLNSVAADLPQATIIHCRFEVDDPFLINRHYPNFYAVDLGDASPSEVSFSEFIGGQGCLSFKAKRSSVHHNYFVNRQTVTNHYSIMAMGDSSKIFLNRIEPEIGSGVEVYVHRGVEIFNNSISISSSPPTCEYGHEEFSTTAIRLADYHARPGSPNACYGNKVYNNKISIRANDYPDSKRYIPMCWAVYYSASGGDNEIFGNTITIEKPVISSKAITAAFYVCGGIHGFGGKFYNNQVTTNVPAAWIASFYGGAINTKMYNNTIIKSATANADFKPFRLGSSGCDECLAKNIEFRSNTVKGAPLDFEATDQDHSYSVYWTLDIKVADARGKLEKNAEVVVRDKDNNIVMEGKTDNNGKLKTELPEYTAEGKQKKFLSPYTVSVGNWQKKVELNKNTELYCTTN